MTLLISSSTSCPDDSLCSFCSGDFCLQCYKGFADSSGTCQKVQKEIANCLFYSDSKTCSSCEQGFGLVANKCQKCQDQKCAICNKDVKACTACLGSILVKSGNCEAKDQCPDSNCEVCKPDFQCLQCKENFTLNQNTNSCEVSKIKNCKILRLGEDKSCLVCGDAFFITKKGTCDRVKNSMSIRPEIM